MIIPINSWVMGPAMNVHYLANIQYFSIFPLHINSIWWWEQCLLSDYGQNSPSQRINFSLAGECVQTTQMYNSLIWEYKSFFIILLLRQFYLKICHCHFPEPNLFDYHFKDILWKNQWQRTKHLFPRVRALRKRLR